MDARWGLSRGLLSGMISTTGMCEAPTDALALFATLWASVSLSLQIQKQVMKGNAGWKI